MRLDRDLGGWWWLERWSCLVSADTAVGAVASARHGKSNLLHCGEQLGLSRELVAAIATSAEHHVKRKHLGVGYMVKRGSDQTEQVGVGGLATIAEVKQAEEEHSSLA